MIQNHQTTLLQQHTSIYNWPAHKNHEYANTWFLRATVRLPPARKSEIWRCAGRLKDTPDNVVASCVLYRIRMLRCIRARLRAPARSPTSLQAVSYIAYACSDALGPDSEHRRAVQVSMIVYSKQRRRFRPWRGTLLGWLGESFHP